MQLFCLKSHYIEANKCRRNINNNNNNNNNDINIIIINNKNNNSNRKLHQCKIQTPKQTEQQCTYANITLKIRRHNFFSWEMQMRGLSRMGEVKGKVRSGEQGKREVEVKAGRYRTKNGALKKETKKLK